MFEHITINLSPSGIRHDRMEGRDYIVAPMVMLTEGVHAGSNGPLYYPTEELAKTPQVWNHKPVVVYHPTINGEGVSACDPDIVDKYKIGVVMNTKWDATKNKLKAEAWIEVNRANEVDERIMQAIENNKPMELSTGVFTDNEASKGTWNTEEYVAVARNYRPDHLALLPDQIGACSMKDGAGFLVANALSHDDIRSSLYTSLRERLGRDAWIVDVFESSVIYEHDGKLWKLMYTRNNDVASLGTEAPVRVHRNVQYRTVDGALIGNAEFPLTPRTGEIDMSKKTIVDGLIANDATNWVEADRDGLMAMNEDQLKKMSPKPIVNKDETDDDDEKSDAADLNDVAPEDKPKTDNAGAPQITLDQLPPEMQAVYNHGLQTLQRERKTLIDTITANEANVFSAEQLGTMSLEQLQGMAALAKKQQAAPAHNASQQAVALFSGQATPAAPTANAKGEAPKPLGLPTMNFEKTA